MNIDKSSISSLPEYDSECHNKGSHSVVPELNTYSTFDVEKSAGLSPLASEHSTMFVYNLPFLVHGLKDLY